MHKIPSKLEERSCRWKLIESEVEEESLLYCLNVIGLTMDEFSLSGGGGIAGIPRGRPDPTPKCGLNCGLSSIDFGWLGSGLGWVGKGFGCRLGTLLSMPGILGSVPGVLMQMSAKQGPAVVRDSSGDSELFQFVKSL